MQQAEQTRPASGRKLKIAVAIPTYNRLEKLKVALRHIEAQEVDERFELYCVISNIASQDGTTEFLSQLNHPTVRYVIHNTSEENVNGNWRRCGSTVPDEVDWVWFHGDDDYITTPQAIKGLVSLLLEQGDERLKLVHVCQGLRSRATGKRVRGNLLDLCNAIGYHEVLGWMSSVVMRTQEFKGALELATRGVLDNPTEEVIFSRKMSAYAQCAAMLRMCKDGDGIFWDVPWIDPQDRVQTPESIARWQGSNIGERYFFVVDDILKMVEDGTISRPLKPMFFRYHTYTLWDRYAAFLISAVVNSGQMTATQLEHLDRIRRMDNCFTSGREKKLFLQWHQSLSARLQGYVRHAQETVRLRTDLVEHFKLANAGVYPFQILSPEGAPLT